MVKWTTPAKSDLRDIHDYIARDSKFYAQKVAQTVVSRSEMLNDFPEIGRIVSEIGDHSIREVFVYSYRLIYEISPNGVHILALIHSKRDFSSGNLDELRK
ncbi:MAG TPA: type II toxin-antitoxin system RelE/ParE family toxin [Proteobacteria bacterium]|nr:type II toxin-antitoxin system RelE/ParE family toxin [Pseudomonadota bacterium]